MTFEFYEPDDVEISIRGALFQGLGAAFVEKPPKGDFDFDQCKEIGDAIMSVVNRDIDRLEKQIKASHAKQRYWGHHQTPCPCKICQKEFDCGL